MRRPDLRPILTAGRRPRLAAGIALIATVAVVIAVVLSSGAGTPTTSSSDSTQTAGSTTVQRRDLVATDTQSGTLGYADPQTVYNRLGGTITWLPSVGQVIKPGQTLYEVNGRPVILLDGRSPAFRDLNASDPAGQDILQLNRSLIALGFNPDGIVADDVWQAATTAGVDVFQASLGETETGSLSLGQVVFLPGQQLVSSLTATLGDGGSGNSAAAPASARPAASGSEFVSLTTTTTATMAPKPKPAKPHPARPHPTKRVPAQPPSGSAPSRSLSALTALLRAEAAQLRAAAAALRAANAASSRSRTPSSGSKNSGSPSSSSSSGSSGSSAGGSASAVLQTASRQLIATVDLDASKQSEAKVGEKVTVQMPAGNTVNGVITAVSSVAQSSSSAGNGGSPSGAGNGNGNGNGGSGSSAATIPVTIRLKGHIGGAGLDQAAVSVNFIQAVAKNVLSVPVTALLATSGGGYAVKEATTPDKLLPVTTGLFAAGYVQISGPGIAPGLSVTDSQG